MAVNHFSSSGTTGSIAIANPSMSTSSFESSFSGTSVNAVPSPRLSATSGNPAAQLLPNIGTASPPIPLDDNDKSDDNETTTRMKKKKRTKSGCSTCRKRKVKCGEEKPTCQRCYQARIECAGYPSSTTKNSMCPNVTRSTEDSSRRSTATSSSHTRSSSGDSSAQSDALGGSASPSSQRPVRKAVRLTRPNPTESSILSTFSISTANSGPVHSGSHTSHSSLSARSNATIATAPGLSPAESTGSLQPRFAASASLSASHTSSSGLESDYNGSGRLRYQANSSQPAFSPTLAPPPQPQVHHSQVQPNENTFAPFAFDSPFPLQPFASVFAPLPHSHDDTEYGIDNNQSTTATGGVMQTGNTPIGFDSLFGYTGNSLPHQQNGGIALNDNGDEQAGGMDANLPGAPFPMEYWEDPDFVDTIMNGFRNVTGTGDLQADLGTSASTESHPQITLENSASAQFAYQIPSNAPSLSSGRSSILSPTARTPSSSSPAVLPVLAQDPQVLSHYAAETQSSFNASTDVQRKGPLMSSISQRSFVISETSTIANTNTTMADFAPQPAIDPILQATSTLELHKQAANRTKIVPSLNELAMGPPPNLLGNQKEWSIPFEIEEILKGMSNSRHVELLKHYFINLVGLFSPIDHPRNPFRTFVAEHATESLCLLHAVLAVSALNQQPLSAEARAESLLYFEAAVDLYVRSLQQQDDISLFTLLFLSLYYAFDSGTAQPQHFSRRAQNIINERLELLSYDVLQASNDFRFLVRMHVWYEVMANISRRAGDLRDMSCGQYTISHLLSIIEKWDVQEEKAAALSGVNADFIMTGCVGVPTFFISLLNDISLLKEEQYNILAIPVENLDEQGRFIRKVIISKHTSKIRDLEFKIQYARPGRLLVPPIVANELALHRAVSVRFFDLFRLAASIHLLSELQGTPINDPAVQLRTTEMVKLLGNIEQNSNYNTSGIWAFFIAGAASSNHMDRIALHRRLDSTWNSPCGNVWSLRSILDEVWQRNAEALENKEPCQNWKEIAQQRGWLLLLM